MKTKRQIGRKIISFLITMAMVVGMIPGMSLTAYASTNYGLWVGGTEVTSENASDVFNDNKVSFNPGNSEIPATLTLNGYTYSGVGHTGTVYSGGIYYEGTNPLKLLIVGTNSITSTSSEQKGYGIYSTKDVTIDGNGKLTVNAEGNTFSRAIYCDNAAFNINSGTVNVKGKFVGIYGRNGVTINGGIVEVTAEYGISGTGNTSALTIGQNVSSVSITGTEQATDLKIINAVAGTGWTNTYGTEDKANIEVETQGQTLTYKKILFPALTEYPLWIGGVQVTSANANNIDGNNKVSYDADKNTLTLNGASINTGYDSAGIYYNTGDDTSYYDNPLNIILKGNNSIIGDGITTGIYGAGYYGSFTFSGDGSLNTSGTSSGISSSYGNVKIDSGTIKASGTDSSGINAKGGLTINDGNVEATGANYGIQTMYGVNITGGTVTAEATNSTSGSGSAIYDGCNNNKGISITGGTVTATGTSSSGEAYGLYLGGSGSITIGSDITSLTVVGKTSASKGNVKNSVAGMGWSTVEGTGDGAEIAVNTSGASLASYKKILFPYAKPAASVTTAPAPVSGLVYTGSEQKLVTAGAASGGTMKYAIGENASTEPKSGWSTSIPTATDARTYYVWYKAVGDNGHSDSKSGCVEVTIAAKQESASVKKTPKAITGLIYNGSAQKLVEAGEAENGTLYYAVTDTDTEPESSAYSTDIPSKTNAGTYYVWYKAVGSEGYDDSEVGNVKVEIADNEEDEEDDDNGDELPKLLEITKDSITVETIDGFEFSINNGTDWQDSGKFENLESGHEYTIQIRKKGSEEILDKIYAKTNDSDKVTETKEQFRQTIDNGTGTVKAETRVREDVPVGKIENITLDFAKAVMNEDELSRVRKGENCLIYLEVSGNEAQQEQTNIGEKVRENKPGAAFGMIFDISLFKKIEDDEAKKITKRFEENPLEITMNVPEELQSENRMFYVGCEHVDGDTTDTEFIETDKSDDGKQLTFDITGCSTYALYFVDPQEASDESNAASNAGYVAKQRVDAKKLMNLPAGVKIKYITSDKKLAKVTRKGIIKIKKNAGTVTITAKNKKTGATIDSCTLVIEKPIIKQKKLIVHGVIASDIATWQKRSADEFLCNTTVKPQWYSSKPSVAEVNKETGEVTIKGKGRAKIYAVFGSDALKSKFGTRKVYKYKIVSKK